MTYYGYRSKTPEIERRGHAARIINTNEVKLTDYDYRDRYWRYGQAIRRPSDTLKELATKDQKALLAGARTSRERKALAALM